MLRDPYYLLAHLEAKLSEEERELLRDMQRLIEGEAEVSEEQVRARLRAVPPRRWDLLEATIMAKTEAEVQAYKARLREPRVRQRVYEEVAGVLRRLAEVWR